MALSKEQEDLYRKTMEEAKGQLETIDDDMEKEIQKARERLAKLQESKRSFRQLYEGAARLLGRPSSVQTFQKLVVVVVLADPEPRHDILFAVANHPVVLAHADRPRVRVGHPFEVKAREVPLVLIEQVESFK